MRLLSIVSILVAASLGVGCKKGDDNGAGGGATAAKPAPAAPAAQLAAVDVSVGGEAFTGLSVQAPAGAVAKESFGSVEVTAGDGFALQISEDAADFPALKKEIEDNDINKLKRFVVETPDEQLYESEVMGKTQFHFNANVKVGDAAFRCENVKGGVDKTLAQTQAMVAACKSLAAAAPAPAAADPAPAAPAP